MTQPLTPQPGAKAEPAADPSAPQTLAFETVPVQPTADGWTPARQRAFIEALADCGCVTEAAASVGMTARSAQRLRRRTGAESFDLAWAAALEQGIEHLAAMMLERAINGVTHPVRYKGEIIGTRTVHNDRLAMYLISRADRQRAERVRWNGEVLDRYLAPRDVESVAYHWDRSMEELEQGAGMPSAGPDAGASAEPTPAPALNDAAPPPDSAPEESPDLIWEDGFGVWLTDAPFPDEGEDTTAAPRRASTGFSANAPRVGGGASRRLTLAELKRYRRAEGVALKGRARLSLLRAIADARDAAAEASADAENTRPRTRLTATRASAPGENRRKSRNPGAVPPLAS